jgi:hypothetical protein
VLQIPASVKRIIEFLIQEMRLTPRRIVTAQPDEDVRLHAER